MNVLLVASKYPPDYSGSGKRLHDLYRRLKQENGDIYWEVLSTRGKNLRTGYYEKVRVWRVPGARDAIQVGPAFMRKFIEVIYGIRELFHSLDYLRRLQANQVEIVHTCGWSWCVIAACLWAHYKKIALVRELTFMNDHPLSSSWMRPIIRMTLTRSTKIVAISPYLAEKCGDAGFSKKVWCRPNPIDERKFKVVSDKEKMSLRRQLFPEMELSEATLLLNVGRIRPIKNQLVLITILSGLPENYYLVLAGPVSRQHQAYLESIYQEITAAKLDHRVIVREGHHRNPERFMQASDILLFPSVSEGLGTVMLEALMCGLPVIASPLRGITDSVIDDARHGYVVPFQDREAVVEAIKNASVLISGRELISAKAKRRFSSEIIDRQYIAILRGISSTNPENP